MKKISRLTVTVLLRTRKHSKDFARRTANIPVVDMHLEFTLTVLAWLRLNFYIRTVEIQAGRRVRVRLFEKKTAG